MDDHETDQLARRMKYWVFPRAAPETRNRTFNPCPACWIKWVLARKLERQGDHGTPPDAFATKLLAARLGTAPTAPPFAPAADFLPAAAPGAPPPSAATLPCRAPPETAPAAFFAELTQLMAWRERGLLSDSEFANAKHMLGLR